MDYRLKIAAIVGGVVAVALLIWVGIAWFNYKADEPARKYATEYAEMQPVSTTQVGSTTVVKEYVTQTSPHQSESFWPYFFWGYMMGGNNTYREYRTTVNNTYRSSPEYQAVQEAKLAEETAREAAWAEQKAQWSSEHSGSWGSDSSSWSSDDSDSGSWGGGSSWSSDDRGSWGSSYDSGSWGGGGSDWSSSGSGSWGD